MDWRDMVLAIASSLFGYSLIPQIVRLYKHKCANQISWQLIMFSIIGVCMTAVALFSQGWYISATCNCCQLLCWSIVVIQKITYSGNEDIDKYIP